MTAAGAGLRVGFVGLGDMGGPMAANLLDAGCEVSVYDLSAESCSRLEKSGARVARSLGDVPTDVEIVCVCVVNDEQLESVCLGGDGLVQAMSADQLLVVHSTVLPETMEAIGAAAAPRGIRVLDAPVSGARPASLAGTLTIIVGGDDADVKRAMPMLEIVGAHVRHMGALGAGQRTKIVNNVMLHGNHAVMMEALRLAKAFELNETELLEVVRGSSGNSWLIETYPYIDDIMFTHTMAGTDGMYDIMTKELWNAVKSARARHIGLPVTAVAIQTYRDACLERMDELVRRGTFDDVRTPATA